MPDRRELPSAQALNEMSRADFVLAWRSIVGEPPAVVLDDRAEMIRILAEAVQARWTGAGQQVSAPAHPAEDDRFPYDRIDAGKAWRQPFFRADARAENLGPDRPGPSAHGITTPCPAGSLPADG